MYVRMCVYVCARLCLCMYVRMYVPVLKFMFNKKSDFIHLNLNSGSVKPIENFN
jgi:hypothetical protein